VSPGQGLVPCCTSFCRLAGGGQGSCNCCHAAYNELAARSCGHALDHGWGGTKLLMVLNGWLVVEGPSSADSARGKRHRCCTELTRADQINVDVNTYCFAPSAKPNWRLKLHRQSVAGCDPQGGAVSRNVTLLAGAASSSTTHTLYCCCPRLLGFSGCCWQLITLP
jgi:hypothetical protein